MGALSKRRKESLEKLAALEAIPVAEAVALLKEIRGAKFVESMDVAINLGIDAKKTDQAVRGSTVLPRGTGKQARIAVFASGEAADSAKAAGADVVGMEDLAEKMKSGDLNYDVVIAAPDAMKVVGGLGQVLGPRGLMPNPKVGTVTADVAGAVKNAKLGQVRYRTDKGGIVHCTIGRVEFEVDSLVENLSALLADIKKLKPSSAKGVYFKRVTLSTTMGPGIVVDLASLPI